MLSIVNTLGQELELDPDTTITVEKNNPLFNDSADLLQDKSFQFKVPSTEPNKLYMKLAHLAEANNEVYRQQVVVKYGDDVFLTGNLKCSIVNGEYQPNLEPNLVALNALIKGIKMTDIVPNDSYFQGTDHFVSSADYETFDAFMLDTLANPSKYPFYFLPVENTSIDVRIQGLAYPWANYYSFTEQRYRSVRTDTSGTYYGIHAPQYKLPYIFKKIAEYLGLTPVGDFFSDPEWQTVCIYTRQLTLGTFVQNSMMYMPGLLLADFIKQVRDRFHLAIDLDLTRAELTVESFATIIKSEPRDISAWVSSFDQELPEPIANKVTLKSDDQDAAFAVVVGDNTTYPPLYQLTVGSGDTVKELDCSTLKGVDLSTSSLRGQRYCQVSQNMYMGGAGASGGFADDGQGNFSTDLADYRQFQLRFVRFLGYNEITPGKFYPENGPVELDTKDIQWYQFLNDSRRYIITAFVPPNELSQWKTTGKFTFKTPGYNYVDVIIEKFTYDIGANTELVPVKIYVRTINFEVETPVAITTVNTEPDADYLYQDGVSVQIDALVKAYFDPALHGISQVDFNIITTRGYIGYPGPSYDPIFKSKPVLFPTNAKGAGGKAAEVYRTFSGFSGDDELLFRQEFRVYSGHPKYLNINGNNDNFIQHSSGDYYYVTIAMQLNGNDYYRIFY